MPRRSAALTRYLRAAGMNVSRNVQELFGTTEAAVDTRPDPTPQHEGVYAGNHASAKQRQTPKGEHGSPRGRRGRD